jgi:vancomycin permeability regulator SanA
MALKQLDYAGFDTYDTCYRAHALFGVDSAILVTHGYHLPRALLTCNTLGVSSVGVKADRPHSSFPKHYLLREVFSLNKAAVQLVVRLLPGVLGPKENGVTAALARVN